MQVFDLKGMKPEAERERNVLFSGSGYTVRLVPLAPGGEILPCEMAVNVVFCVIEGSVRIKVDSEEADLYPGHCLVTGPALISMRSEGGARLLGVQITPS